MSTFNGSGTMYYGWRHLPDGTAVASKWFAIVWLPVLPLKRHHLRVLTDFQTKEPFVRTADRGLLAGVPEEVTQYELLSVGPVKLSEVVSTYSWTYIIGAVLVAWPALLFWAFIRVLDVHPSWREADATMYGGLLLGLLLIVNPITVALIAVRRARGFQGAVFE
jgi:hypothetical protein